MSEHAPTADNGSSAAPAPADAIAAATRRPEVLLRRVKLRNYKSIPFCDVTLGPLTVLVGHNGSGKSNFLDALSFLHDCLYWSFDRAIGERGGFSKLRYLGAAESETITIEIELDFAD